MNVVVYITLIIILIVSVLGFSTYQLLQSGRWLRAIRQRARRQEALENLSQEDFDKLIYKLEKEFGPLLTDKATKRS